MGAVQLLAATGVPLESAIAQFAEATRFLERRQLSRLQSSLLNATQVFFLKNLSKKSWMIFFDSWQSVALPGLRSSEIERLDWAEVHLDERSFTSKKEVDARVRAQCWETL